MGNASGKDFGEIGNGDPSVRSEVDDRGEGKGKCRVSSAESMGNTPPGSPGRDRSPLLFAPQIPVAPINRAVHVPVLDQTMMDDSAGSLDQPLEKGIPTMITWSQGGDRVSVEGSWDNWSSRRLLQRSGKDHVIILMLPTGSYQCRFFVDGELRVAPDLAQLSDETGPKVNIIEVDDYVPENLDTVADFEAPPSPVSSYGRPFPVDEDFAKEPALVPPQLHLTVLGEAAVLPAAPAAVEKPQHVVLNHLYIEKGWTAQSLVALGLTHRFKSKYVTVVLYKPLRR
ncbi:5'-AMP-activated protein kinase beta-2 subunit protein [Wolffia australiana]